MEFKDQLKQLGEKAIRIQDHLLTEEAVKHSIIIPFITLLGYDTTDPDEVLPEYITDVGIKKGEKIDYAILRNGIPEILIECKHLKEDLRKHDDQLRRYFHVSPARFAILTNGLDYWFFSDLVDANKMDEKPFLTLNITNLKPDQIAGVTKFQKQHFSRDSIFDAVKVLKHIREIKALFQQELANPSDEFVKLFAYKIYPGSVTARILQQFTDLTRISISEYMTDWLTDKIAANATKEQELIVQAQAEQAAQAEPERGSGIVTTQEELEGFYIVKSILRKSVEANRITYRDSLSYFAILLDDNNRKTICRLHFNGAKKYIGTFDEAKNETRHLIESLDDIYKYARPLNACAEHFVNAQKGLPAVGGDVVEALEA